jgi:hypothetical protein
MLPVVSDSDARAILGALLAIASVRGCDQVTEADEASIAGVSRYMFRQATPLDLDDLAPVVPAALAHALGKPELAAHALQLLAVMALVDGVLDSEKIVAVAGYAQALGIEEAYLAELTEAAAGHLRWALMDMTRKNIESVFDKPWAEDGDTMALFLPYRNGATDPVLAARYEALGKLLEGSFGRAFWEFYKLNGYAFPGQADALNARFATPHDATHVVSGYDTTAPGEVLVSTFTAAMHRKWPMAGHILPVIFSWHLGIKINDIAKSTTGSLDPEKFWQAWARGAAVDIDLFDPGWDFWSWTGESLEALRRHHGVTPL